MNVPGHYDIHVLAAEMDMVHEAGMFVTRGDGLMQFPVGRFVVSIGIGELHYGMNDGSSVEVAVLTQHEDAPMREFVTRDMVRGAGLGDRKDDVAIVTPEELTVLIRYLINESETP